MREKSQIEVILELKLENIDKILSQLNKLAELISAFDNVSEIISKGTNSFVPDMRMNNMLVINWVVSLLQSAWARIYAILLGVLAGAVATGAWTAIQDMFKRPKSEYEQLLELRGNLINELDRANDSLDSVKQSGDVRGAYTAEMLPRNQELIENRINVLNEFLQRVTELINELDRGEIRSINPIPKFGQPGEVIINPIDDRIKDLLKEYERIQKDEAEKLEEFKNSIYGSALEELSLLNNALAMTGDTSLIFAGNQDIVSDAMNGVMASSVALRQNGIDPLTGTTKESGEAVIDLVSGFEDGAVVFGYTKDELLGPRRW